MQLGLMRSDEFRSIPKNFVQKDTFGAFKLRRKTAKSSDFSLKFCSAFQISTSAINALSRIKMHGLLL